MARSKTRLRFIFGLKVKSKFSRVRSRVAKVGLFAAPFEQSVAAPGQFVGDQARDQVDRRHGFGLCLAQSGFEHGGHAAEPELA